MSEHLHNGHRQRMRLRIMNEGIDNLQEHEVLEYLLYSFVPRKDTNELAHRLIEEFGSLRDIFNSSPEHIKKVSGMTENASLFLSVLTEIVRKYGFLTASYAERIRLSNHGEAKQYLVKKFAGLNEERFYAVALDINDRIVGEKVWASGKRSQVTVKPAEIVDFATKTKAISIIMAHNHPSCSANPSIDDIRLTREICTLLNMLDYKLRDHLIFGNKGDYYSFEEQSYIRDWIKEGNSFKEGSWHVYE